MDRIFEKSSGGIVYRKVENQIDILLLERRNMKGEVDYVLPKGHMEKWETAKETALREIAEETGLEHEKLEIIKFMNKINYSFVASHLEGSPLIDKDVYLFLVKYTGNLEPVPFGADIDESEPGEKFSGISWKSLKELETINMKPDIVGFVKKNITNM